VVSACDPPPPCFDLWFDLELRLTFHCITERM
jgi:hypothetical protein